MIAVVSLDSYFDEVSQFTLNIIKQNDIVPMVFTGLKDSGRRFAVVLNGLLEVTDKQGFIRTVLSEENCIMYGSSAMMGKYIEESNSVEEELTIGVASAKNAIFGNWRVFQKESDGKRAVGEPKIYLNQKPDNPITWNLSIIEVSDSERYKHLELWQSIKQKALWL